MRKILDFIYSTRLTAVLFVVFALAMAIATFIENDFGTPTARKLVYTAWWFEGIMLVFVINFFGNIFKYRLFQLKKVPVLVFHLAFLLIIIGAWVTRYISYEGIMPIPEGHTTNKFLSEKIYLSVHQDDRQDIIVKELLMGKLGNNRFSAASEDGDTKVSFIDYVPNAQKKLVSQAEGETYLQLVESSSGSRQDHYIPYGDHIKILNTTVSFGEPMPGAIHIFSEGGQLKIQTPQEGTFMRMADRMTGEVVKDSIADFQVASLYQFGNIQFVVPKGPQVGQLEYATGDPNEFRQDMLVLQVQHQGEAKEVRVSGGAYMVEPPTRVQVGGSQFSLSYGSRYIELPFSLKLRDFQLEKYPGSESPSSYASEVTLIDTEQNQHFDYRIFMNHILNYRGYKFFQSNYVIGDGYEETQLSVNHDRLGTTITYIGYGLLYLGLLLILFMKNTRFSHLRKQLRKIQEQKKAMATLIWLLLAVPVFGQHDHDTHAGIPHGSPYGDVDSFLLAQAIPTAHADIWGRLIVQDHGGRMKPINTMSSELLRKLSKKDSYRGMNSEQALVSMIMYPEAWYYAPVIYIKEKDKATRGLLGVPKGQKYVRLIDFLDENGGYKIRLQVEKAFNKKIKSEPEKSLLQADERANLLYGALENGRLFRLFPLANDPTNKWYAATDPAFPFQGDDSLYVTNILPLYARAQAMSRQEGTNDSLAINLLTSIGSFQERYGASVMPSERQVELEVMYNKYDIFKKLFSYYMYIGTLLFLFVLAQIFKDGRVIRKLIYGSMAIIVLLFALHTAGLGVRWYISGHTPWSNAYESMIYIAWATMLFGIIFARRSPLTMGASAFLTSMMLMIAHWNWMDPTIENLVPVLNSYWLMIHVSVIVASYGPFALSMIIGISALILMVLTNEKNKERIALQIKELTTINEMSMTIGLVLLTIGNFLGGQWANESWGRYWGWDPKETWALISIMVYAFILHIRLVPGLRGRFTFNALSVFGFSTILMTYFGVNFYLSGLHSYASGEPAATPAYLYYIVVAIVFLTILAGMNYRKMKEG